MLLIQDEIKFLTTMSAAIANTAVMLATEPIDREAVLKNLKDLAASCDDRKEILIDTKE